MFELSVFNYTDSWTYLGQKQKQKTVDAALNLLKNV